MSTICLQNLVTIKNPCEPTNNITGVYDLLDAPELNLSTISNFESGEFTKGYDVMKNLLKFAIKELEVDLKMTLQANNLTKNVNNTSVTTGIFDETNTNPANGMTGIVLHQKNTKGIRRLKINKIQIFPMESIPDAKIYFIDNYKQSEVSINLTGGEINEFEVDYVCESSSVKILLFDVKTYSSVLTCLVGCSGTKQNECGYVKGWNKNVETNKEGFGINAVFSCECDYAQILCTNKDIASKLIYLKTRILLLEERISSTRLTPFIIYGKEEAIGKRLELINEFNTFWNQFVDTLKHYTQIDEDCFNCTGAKKVVNV